MVFLSNVNKPTNRYYCQVRLISESHAKRGNGLDLMCPDPYYAPSFLGP